MASLEEVGSKLEVAKILVDNVLVTNSESDLFKTQQLVFSIQEDLWELYREQQKKKA